MNRINNGSSDSLVVELTKTFKPGEERFSPPGRPGGSAPSLIRGRLTCHDVTLLVRLEGTPEEIDETLEYWKACSFQARPVHSGGTA